jgi:hypothetical protein
MRIALMSLFLLAMTTADVANACGSHGGCGGSNVSVNIDINIGRGGFGGGGCGGGMSCGGAFGPRFFGAGGVAERRGRRLARRAERRQFRAMRAARLGFPFRAARLQASADRTAFRSGAAFAFRRSSLRPRRRSPYWTR